MSWSSKSGRVLRPQPKKIYLKIESVSAEPLDFGALRLRSWPTVFVQPFKIAIPIYMQKHCYQFKGFVNNSAY